MKVKMAEFIRISTDIRETFNSTIWSIWSYSLILIDLVLSSNSTGILLTI